MGFYEAERVMAAESWRPSRRKGMLTKKKKFVLLGCLLFHIMTEKLYTQLQSPI